MRGFRCELFLWRCIPNSLNPGSLTPKVLTLTSLQINSYFVWKMDFNNNKQCCCVLVCVCIYVWGDQKRDYMVKERRRDGNICRERDGKERSWEKTINQVGRKIRNIDINYCNRSKMLTIDQSSFVLTKHRSKKQKM